MNSFNLQWSISAKGKRCDLKVSTDLNLRSEAKLKVGGVLRKVVTVTDAPWSVPESFSPELAGIFWNDTSDFFFQKVVLFLLQKEI